MALKGQKAYLAMMVRHIPDLGLEGGPWLTMSLTLGNSSPEKDDYVSASQAQPSSRLPDLPWDPSSEPCSTLRCYSHQTKWSHLVLGLNFQTVTKLDLNQSTDLIVSR